MSGQGYERVPGHEAVTGSVPIDLHPTEIPQSPPPSFRSRASSPMSRRHLLDRSMGASVDPALVDTFDSGLSDEEDNGRDDRQPFIRNAGSRQLLGHDGNFAIENSEGPSPEITRSEQMVNTLGSRLVQLASVASSNDGVFANLNAKPERGEKSEEQPPSYEQAAADATPPYWETTILAPGMVSDEVFIDGLPVGSFFSFAWNGIISMAFQLVGFLLTYLLHTTHAARNGSRAGLGITLINWGFTMKTYADQRQHNTGQQYGQPAYPNDHDFDPSASSDSAASAVTSPSGDTGNSDGFLASSWLSYVVMILGWIVLIKAVSDFVRARRHEQLILQSPDRGLNVPVVAEGESLESVV